MKCDEVSRKLIDYIYEELDGDGSDRVRDHLEECSDCQRRYDRLRGPADLVELVASSLETDSPESKRCLIHTPGLIQEALSRTTRSRSRWRWAAAGCVAALVLVGVLQLFAIKVSVHPTHFVISWGAAPADSAVLEGEPRIQAIAQSLQHQSNRIEEIDQLLRLVVNVIKTDQENAEQQMLAMRVWLQQMQRKNDTRWRTVGYLFRNQRPDPLVSSVSMLPFSPEIEGGNPE